MATTYDDILSRAAEDMLTDMSCAQYLEYAEVYRMEVR